jgi:ABC-type lipoprotein export system ATPase subunit
MAVVVRSVRKVLARQPSPGAPALSFYLDGLDVAEGESLAVVGPSGCGKSLLLGLLAGIVTPDEGTIDWSWLPGSGDGALAIEMVRRRSIGVLLQGENLIASLSALQNVMLGLRFSRSYPRLQWRTRAMEMLSRVGLAHEHHRLPAVLTAPQRQKVALARCLVHHPRLALVDEPTARLDPGSAHQTIQLLMEMCREGGQTLIVFTHDRSMAGHFDRQFDGSQLLVERDSLP